MGVFEASERNGKPHLEFDAAVFNLLARQAHEDLFEAKTPPARGERDLTLIVLLLSLLVIEGGVALVFGFAKGG